jgi:hypothetical protein
LSDLQSLLPSIDASGKETLTQADLPAEGLRIPGFPTILGPFGYTDVRASLSWSLVDVQSLRNYLAARHNFTAAQLSADDARDMVVLTVGNAYLLVLADESQVSSVEAQVATAKISLDQAVANHQAGTAPLLDELRARGLPDAGSAVDCGEEFAGEGQAGTGTHHRPAAGTEFYADRQGALCGLRPVGCGRDDSTGARQPQGPGAMVEQTRAAEEQRKRLRQTGCRR